MRSVTYFTLLLLLTLCCFQPENLFDVLHELISLMTVLPATMIPLFDAKNGVRTVFKLMSSTSEPIRIQSVKLLGHFLARSVAK